MNDQDKSKFPRKGKSAKAADTNQALIAAVSLLSASLGVTAATPADAGSVDVHTPQIQTPKLPTIHTPTPGTPKVTNTYSNSLKLQSNQDKYLSIQGKQFQSNQNKNLQSNQNKNLQSNQDKSD